MGTSSSSLKELQDNKYLQRFSGKDSISTNDPFWNQLLSFTFVPPHNCADFRLLEDSTRSMLDAILTNNPISGNVSALVHIFLTHSAELKESVLCENKVFVWQTYNSLFILRSVLKCFIETSGEEGMLKQLSFDNHGSESLVEDGESLLNHLINTLIEIIVDVALKDLTYAIIVEAINTLLVLLSVQMFSSRPAHSSVVYKIVMLGKCNIHSLLLVKTLLLHYINQEKCPHCINSEMDSHSLISGLATGFWNILTLSYVRGTASSDKSEKTILANQSLLLLLALVNHCTGERDIKNPYRDALFSFQNATGESTVEISTDTIPAFKLDFDSLFSTLCNTLKDDQTTLLLYLLLHKNASFKQYIISLPKLDVMVVPILKILYHASEKNSHHIYMALIVLLILSEDEHFDKQIHHVKLQNITWYTERHLSEVTLGGLIILILSRTIQYNMTRLHDKYLHTNCLAALANMSAYFQNLHPYVCQKFISLLEYISKRMARINEKLRSGEMFSSGGDVDDMTSPAEIAQDLAVLEEVIRMLLEILNSCLSAQLKSNVNLLYAMLYNRSIFSNFQSHPPFEDIMQNINKVLVFFSEFLHDLDQNPSVLVVYQVISDATAQWPRDNLRKFPELKFKYVEEGQPEDFFIPYLWSLVYHASDIYWNPKNIFIFNPHKAP